MLLSLKKKLDMRFLVDFSNSNVSVIDKIVEGFNEEIDGYLYSRFGD